MKHAYMSHHFIHIRDGQLKPICVLLFKNFYKMSYSVKLVEVGVDKTRNMCVSLPIFYPFLNLVF